MAPLSRSAFRSRLRRLSRTERAALVADLWEARGWETRVEGARVVATDHPDREDRVLAVGRAGPDADRVDPDAVYDALLYAVDREAAERLCRRHLDRPLRGVAGDDRPRRTRRTRRLAAVGVVALALVAAAVLASAGGPHPSAGTTAATAAPSPPDDVPAATDVPRGERSAGDVAPGLTTAGVTSTEELGRAHARLVSGRSYRWRLVVLTYPGNATRGEPTANLTEHVQVASSTRYRSDVTARGEMPISATVIAGYETYADGERRYIRARVPGATVASLPIEVAPDDPFADRSRRVIDRFLTAERTSVVDVVTRDGVSFYRVTAIGRQSDRVTDYSSVALVTTEGFVGQIRTAYRVPDANVTVVVRVTYRDLGDPVDLSPPPWVREHRNATDAAAVVRPVLTS